MNFNEIELFSGLHLIYIFFSLIFCVSIPLLGKKFCFNKSTRIKWVWGLILFTIFQEFIDYYNRMQVRTLDPEIDLPLHLCNIALFASTIALYNKNLLLFESAYYWGMGASFQAMLTPDISDFDNYFTFVTFYLHHALIITHVLWLIIVEKLWCRKGSILRIMIITNIVAIFIFSINLLIGGKANYMYLISKPPVNNPLILGEWPWYILNLEIIIFFYMLIIYIPFFINNKLNHTKIVS